MLCENCKAAIPSLASRQRKANDALHALGLQYYQSVPWLVIEQILASSGFSLDATMPLVNTNRMHEPVGENKWLTCSWHRMPSGRYEVVAYVN